MAHTFEDVIFKMTCERLTQAALRYYRKADSPVHPSFHAVHAVLAGVCMVHIDLSGFITIVTQR